MCANPTYIESATALSDTVHVHKNLSHTYISNCSVDLKIEPVLGTALLSVLFEFIRHLIITITI